MKILKKMWSKFLTVFGNIKCFSFPMFLVYDPDDYQITGQDMQDISELLLAGDIVLRGYNNYLDGKFIPNFPNGKIGKGFSHGAVYIGDNMLMHAVSSGVQKINVFDFCQCDRIAVFRPRSGVKQAIKLAKSYEGKPYDFLFEDSPNAIYCFELCRLAYPKLDIKPIEVKRLFGLLKKKVYVAQSFVESKDCKLVYCKNQSSRICYRKYGRAN